MTTLADFSQDIEALAKLLSSTGTVQDDVPSTSEVSRPSATPASIGTKDLLPVKVPSPKARDNNDIWTAEDLECSAADDDFDLDDGRHIPEFELKYKQSVTTADNFLGMSGKDPSSNCCEELLVQVQMPQSVSAADMDLDITTDRLRLWSAVYKLSVHLPQKVDSVRGRAKWNSKTKVLSVTVPIIREDVF